MLGCTEQTPGTARRAVAAGRRQERHASGCEAIMVLVKPCCLMWVLAKPILLSACSTAPAVPCLWAHKTPLVSCDDVCAVPTCGAGCEDAGILLRVGIAHAQRGPAGGVGGGGAALAPPGFAVGVAVQARAAECGAGGTGLRCSGSAAAKGPGLGGMGCSRTMHRRGGMDRHSRVKLIRVGPGQGGHRRRSHTAGPNRALN